jgi:hypothetical protein
LCAGNTSALCTTAYAIAPDVPSSSLQVPSPVVHELFYTVVDEISGDIYWTEDLSRRVLVLRASSSVPVRIAGNGAKGRDAGGTVARGSVALNTALAVPSGIVLDAHRLPVFLDGYQPGRILRITAAGILEAIVTIGLSPSISAPIVDGPIAQATAYSLSGITFVADANALLVADTAQYSTVRRIDLDAAVVSTVLGTQDKSAGSEQDGTTSSSALFGKITAIVSLAGGSIVVSDAGNSVLRIAIAENATYVSGLIQYLRCLGELVVSVAFPCALPTDQLPSWFCMPLRDPRSVHKPRLLLPSQSTATSFCIKRVFRRSLDLPRGLGRNS